MQPVVSIKINQDEYPELVIHPQTAAVIGLGSKKLAFVSFGNQKHYVNISLNDLIPPEQVLLAPKVVAALHLPDYPSYELAVNHNEIIIGPCIGLLLRKDDNKLTASFLQKMLVYVREYSTLHGAVIVFALNKVDPAHRLIEGYCYNPSQHYWQRGVFTYPAAIYRMIGLSDEWKNHLLAALGDTVFNNRYFSKWEMYQWFANDPDLSPHLPETLLYHTPQDVLDLLERFPQIYIKPVSGLRGRGIVRISKEDHQFCFKYREAGANCNLTLEATQVSAYLQKRFGRGCYLIQQAIDLLEYADGIIDFRCVVQKNQSNDWVCQAIIGRHGAQGSIVSNISNGGADFPGEDLLAKALAPSQTNLLAVQQQIVNFAVLVCNTLTEYGINCGTLGLDIGIDSLGCLLLIEINNRDPDPTIALNIGDRQLYYTLKTGPLWYAKSLAGFNTLLHSTE